VSNLRFNFLEWLPDLDDFGNPGITVADNVIHDVEGYKEVRQQTIGAFSTLTGSATSTAMVVKPIGTGGTNVAAWLKAITAGPSVIMEIGNPEIGLVGSIASATLSSVGAMSISSFQVTELNDKVFLTAQAEGEAQGSTVISINLTGYLDYTVPTPPVSENTAIIPNTKTLTLTGQVPIILMPFTAQPGVGALGITGQIPSRKPLTVVVTPSSFSTSDPSCPITSDTIQAVASEGAQPFSYQWTWQSGGSGMQINSPTSSTTTVTTTGSGEATGLLLMTVTDDDSNQATDTCNMALTCGVPV